MNSSLAPASCLLQPGPHPQAVLHVWAVKFPFFPGISNQAFPQLQEMHLLCPRLEETNGPNFPLAVNLAAGALSAFLFLFLPLWPVGLLSLVSYSGGVLDVKQETTVNIFSYLKHHHTLYLPCSGYCELWCGEQIPFLVFLMVEINNENKVGMVAIISQTFHSGMMNCFLCLFCEKSGQRFSAAFF